MDFTVGDWYIVIGPWTLAAIALVAIVAVVLLTKMLMVH